MEAPYSIEDMVTILTPCMEAMLDTGVHRIRLSALTEREKQVGEYLNFLHGNSCDWRLLLSEDYYVMSYGFELFLFHTSLIQDDFKLTFNNE